MGRESSLKAASLFLFFFFEVSIPHGTEGGSDTNEMLITRVVGELAPLAASQIAGTRQKQTKQLLGASYSLFIIMFLCFGGRREQKYSCLGLAMG